MKFRHSFLAAAALLTTVGAQAQTSNVTLYGTLDQYLNYMKSSSGKSLTSLNDGALMRSRLGFRGTEDLGGGLSAKFTLEHGLYADAGKQNDSTRFFDRQAWVGLATPYGEFRAGRQNTAAFTRSAEVDYSGRTLGSLSNWYGLTARYDNDLAYISPRINGFVFEAHFAPGEQGKGSPASKAVWQFAVDYDGGPIKAGFAGLRARPAAGSAVGKTIVFDNLYGSYDYGQGKVYASVIRSNVSTGSASGPLQGNNAGMLLGATGTLVTGDAGTAADAHRFHNVVQLSADYRVSSALRVGGMVGRIHDTSDAKESATGASLGAFYDLSKRTTVYGMGQVLRNDRNAGFVLAGSAAVLPNFEAADVNGKRLTAMQLGILHRF
ncbi:MAG: porin [Aquabacterium sp.]